MKYYSFETMFISLAEKLQGFLFSTGDYFEISAAGSYYHFEILTDPAGAAAINEFLNNNNIWCRGIA
jgi:hypothetical protein